MSRRALTRCEDAPILESDSPAGRQAPPIAPGSADALAGLAAEYTTRSVRFIAARSPAVLSPGPLDTRPTPAETVLWFHSRIYFKTTRALVGKALIAGGVTRLEDPNVCAKQALFAASRSRAALTQLLGDEVERTALVALLDAIASGIEEQFTERVRPDRCRTEAEEPRTKKDAGGVQPSPRSRPRQHQI